MFKSSMFKVKGEKIVQGSKVQETSSRVWPKYAVFAFTSPSPRPSPLKGEGDFLTFCDSINFELLFFNLEP